MLEATKLGYRKGHKWLVQDIGLHIKKGEFLALLGPNGAGKTTLLRLLSGELSPEEGGVRYLDRALKDFDALDLARTRAYLTQRRQIDFPFTAFEIAMMGRYPHLNGLRETAADHALVRRTLERVGVWPLANRIYTTLSGGEGSRVDFARILAQQPRLLLLDEPTNHLDPTHQLEILKLCRELADEGHTVVAVLHDLNLAALYADHLLLMNQGRQAAYGTPASVLTTECIRDVYGICCEIWRHPSGCPWVVPCRETTETRHDHSPSIPN